MNAYLKGALGRPSCRWSTPCSGLTGLDYEPEKWTPVDSLAWLKAMAWDLRGNMDEEIARTRLSVGRTPEQVDELYPRYPYERHAPIVDRPPTASAGATAPGRHSGTVRCRRSTPYAAASTRSPT